MAWSPTLPASAAPAWKRLADSLAADAAAGVLAPGERLPTHRDLAHRLSLSVGTVTRAYAEAEARGLIEAQVGRGSFVAERVAPETPAGPLDMSRNLPPAGPAAAKLAEAFHRIARRGDLAAHLDYPPPGGVAWHRRAAAGWLRKQCNLETSADRVITTAGAQQAVTAALMTCLGPGDALACEEATFAGLKAQAQQMGWRLIPAAMDDEGMAPEALERAAKGGAKAAYILPVQNPTGRVLGEARRRDLVAVARKLDLVLVEDDLYAPYAAHLGLTPLAMLAPERCFYVTGLSKALAPGLRVGMLTAPAERHGAALDALRAVAFGSPSIGALVAAQWMEDGSADAIFAAVRAETEARCALVRDRLGERVAPSPLSALPHLWLPMDELTAERVAGQALRAGVELTPPRAQVVDGAPVRGLRVCVGGPRSLAETERGAAVIAAAMAQPEAMRDAV